MAADIEEREQINTTLTTLLMSTTNDKHARLLAALARQADAYLFERGDLPRGGGQARNAELTGDDIWEILMRWRRTVRMLDTLPTEVARYASGRRPAQPALPRASGAHPRDLADPAVQESAARIPSPSLSPASLDALADQVEEERRRVNSGGGK